MVLLLHRASNTVSIGHRQMVLLPDQMRLLLALAVADGQRLPRQRAADDLGLPLSATHRLVVSMRSRASRTSFPLNFFVREEAYILQTEVMIVRTLPVPLDPDSLRLVVRLIEACPNDLLVNAARKHFLGE